MCFISSTLHNSIQCWCYYPHFIDEEVEAQRGKALVSRLGLIGETEALPQTSLSTFHSHTAFYAISYLNILSPEWNLEQIASLKIWKLQFKPDFGLWAKMGQAPRAVEMQGSGWSDLWSKKTSAFIVTHRQSEYNRPLAMLDAREDLE